MNNDSPLSILRSPRVLTCFDEESSTAYFRASDIVRVIEGARYPDAAWRGVKYRAFRSGRLQSSDIHSCRYFTHGRWRTYDALTTQGVFALIPLLRSDRAVSFYRWMVQAFIKNTDKNVLIAPKTSIPKKIYQQCGYPRAWVSLRESSKDARLQLTDLWSRSGLEGEAFRVLTEDLTRAWSGMTPNEYKQRKKIGNDSLRDHFTSLELLVNSFAEVANAALIQRYRPTSLAQHRALAKRAGAIARIARRALERALKESLVTNADERVRAGGLS